MRSLFEVAVRLRLPKVTHKPACRNRSVDLQDQTEDRFRQWKRPTSATSLLLIGHATQVEKQREKFVFFVTLRGLILRPLLRVGFLGPLDRRGFREWLFRSDP